MNDEVLLCHCASTGQNNVDGQLVCSVPLERERRVGAAQWRTENSSAGILYYTPEYKIRPLLAFPAPLLAVCSVFLDTT